MDLDIIVGTDVAHRLWRDEHKLPSDRLTSGADLTSVLET